MKKGGESGAAIAPGNAGESLLYQRIRDEEMPPKKSDRFTAEQIALVQAWIDAGAKTSAAAGPDAAANKPRTDHWAFKRLVRPSVAGQVVRKAATSTSPARAPNDESVSASLQAWFRAESCELPDGAAVTRWADASGRGRDLAPTAATTPSGGAAPTFAARSRVSGRVAVRFADENGLASAASNPLPMHGDAAYTVMLVANLQPPGYQFASSVVVGFGEPAPASDPGRPRAALCELIRGTSQLVHAGGFGHNAALPPGSAQAVCGRPVLITIVKHPGPMNRSTEFYLNGLAAGELFAQANPSGTEAVPDVAHRRDFAVMMGRALPQLGGFRGDVAEVAIYDRGARRRRAGEHRGGVDRKIRARRCRTCGDGRAIKPDRRLHRREARSETTHGRAAGRPPRVDPPRVLRSSRFAAPAGARRGVRGRLFAAGVGKPD